MNEASADTPVANDTAVLDEVMVEHPHGDRFLVQRGIFRSMSPKVPEAMYVVTKGDCARRSAFSDIGRSGDREHQHVFRTICCSFWQRWTRVSSVRIQLSYVGDGGLDVSLRASDVRGRKRTISLHSVAGSGELSIDAPLAHFVDGGAMWLEFVATKGSVVVSGVSWTVSAPEFIRPAAVVICTFNRADDCVETVATMASMRER